MVTAIIDRPIRQTGPVEVPPYSYHRRAIDWGASKEHPFVCLFGCVNSGHWFIYDEYWNNSQKLTNQDHWRNIMRMRPWPRASIYYGTTFADPSRPDMIRQFAAWRACPNWECSTVILRHNRRDSDRISCPECDWQGYVRELASMQLSPARNKLYEGIECVRRHLKVDGNGEPLLVIDRSRCPYLARQMATYRWKKLSGKGVNPQAPKPEPLKINDDAVDALRYLIYSEYKQGQKGKKIKGMRVQPPPRESLQFRR